jgi:hypothetical protein
MVSKWLGFSGVLFAGKNSYCRVTARRRERASPRFSIEKRRAQKQAQTPPPQRPARLQGNSARVLTEKKGVFWGCFAEKRGSGLNYLTLCFAFSPVFGTLGFSKPLRLKENRRAEGSKINRA